MKSFGIVLIASFLLAACAPVVMTATPVPATATIAPSATPAPINMPVPADTLAPSSTTPVAGCPQSEALSTVTALIKNVDAFAPATNTAIASAMAVSDKRKADREAVGQILVATQQTSVTDCGRPAYDATIAYMQNTLDFIDAIGPNGKLDNETERLATNDAASTAMRTELKALAAVAGTSIDSHFR